MVSKAILNLEINKNVFIVKKTSTGELSFFLMLLQSDSSSDACLIHSASLQVLIILLSEITVLAHCKDYYYFLTIRAVQ